MCVSFLECFVSSMGAWEHGSRKVGGVLVGFWFRETSLYLILWQPLILSQKVTKRPCYTFLSCKSDSAKGDIWKMSTSRGFRDFPAFDSF